MKKVKGWEWRARAERAETDLILAWGLLNSIEAYADQSARLWRSSGEKEFGRSWSTLARHVRAADPCRIEREAGLRRALLGDEPSTPGKQD